MPPYWKRVPVDYPAPINYLMELDPTNQIHLLRNYETHLVRHAMSPNSNMTREDPFDFYEDALGG